MTEMRDNHKSLDEDLSTEVKLLIIISEALLDIKEILKRIEKNLSKKTRSGGPR